MKAALVQTPILTRVMTLLARVTLSGAIACLVYPTPDDAVCLLLLGVAVLLGVRAPSSTAFLGGLGLAALFCVLRTALEVARVDAGAAIDVPQALLASPGAEGCRRWVASGLGAAMILALAAVLEDLLNDVEGWRPSNRVDPDRLLVVRILMQLGGQRLLRRPITLEGQLEFEEELSQSRLRDLTGTLRRRERTAPVLADVVEAAGIAREVDLGVQDIPLAQIKGSESRTVDFDVAFMPRKRDLRPAWVQLYAEMEGASGRTPRRLQSGRGVLREARPPPRVSGATPGPRADPSQRDRSHYARARWIRAGDA
jgi:hypothetical protein